MSLMNRLDIDLTELGEMAAAAGRLGTFEERISSLNTVFEECGERANAYYCPYTAARQLVQWAVLGFRTACKEGALQSA
ncbi:hypothetical protein ACWC4J_17375 [Streptomyces sp. NPDC001356]